MKIKILLLVLFMFPLLSNQKHEEYYSITQMYYKEKDKSLQIRIKLFTEETEFALNKYYKKKLELNSKVEISEADQLIENYLKLKFNIVINDKLINYQWIGKEFEKDQMIIYLEAKEVEKFNQMEIKNAVFTDIFPSQENIVKVEVNNIDKSLILNKQNEKGLLVF